MDLIAIPYPRWIDPLGGKEVDQWRDADGKLWHVCSGIAPQEVSPRVCPGVRQVLQEGKLIYVKTLP